MFPNFPQNQSAIAVDIVFAKVNKQFTLLWVLVRSASVSRAAASAQWKKLVVVGAPIGLYMSKAIQSEVKFVKGNWACVLG